MKDVILAGGLGTQISEESHLRPKSMIEIGERSILWHIMKIYSPYGFREFDICRKLGFNRLFIRSSSENNDMANSLKLLGFLEHPRIPMMWVTGCSELVELFRQPYIDVDLYEVI